MGIIKAFLSYKKAKTTTKDGQLATFTSFSHIRKYDDAIKWAAKISKVVLPRYYYSEMDAFISSYQKEYAEGKKNGKVDERDADPITSTLFQMICMWAVNEGNVFVWVFSLCMWMLMSRSISVDSLALHCVKRGDSDYIKFKFDETKTDKTGKFVTEKNCYANPFQPYLCFFLALAVWISLNAEVLEKTKKLFLRPGAEFKSASQRYCRQLSELVKRHDDKARKHSRMSRMNDHGLRKGAGVYGSSATTLPPSFVSVAARGEWSIGKILDVYFKFGCGGDQYLGRILAFLNPTKPSFATLPPHWKDPSHASIKRGIKVSFRNVHRTHENTHTDPSSLLSLLLASLVHHSDWIQQIKSKYPNHPFHNLPLFDEPCLLNELKQQVTLEANIDCPTVTGLPPHVDHAIALKEVFEMCTEIKQGQDKFREKLEESVSKAVDKKVAVEGGVNGAILDQKLNALKITLVKEFNAVACIDGGANMDTLPAVNTDNVEAPGPNQFIYTDLKNQMRYWCVPESFGFSNTTIQIGWKKWLMGSVHVEGSTAWKIKPYCKLTGLI